MAYLEMSEILIDGSTIGRDANKCYLSIFMMTMYYNQ